MQNFAPTSYHELVTPSGVNTQVLTGKVANDTGKRVTYFANSGGPIPPVRPAETSPPATNPLPGC